MLIFHYSDCGETIDGPDTETEDQILDRLEQHVIKCPLATFSFEGTTDRAKQRANALKSILGDERGNIRLH
jgi:hypothetical protein